MIELLVVILIIAILIAVAAPSFLKQQDKAHNSAAQQTVAVVSKSMKAIYVSEGQQLSYPSESVIKTQLEQGEPQYTFANVNTANLATYLATSAGDSAGPNNVTFSRDNDNQVTVCVKSKTDAVFCQTRNELGDLANITAPNGKAYAAEVKDGGTILNLYGPNEKAVRCVTPISTLSAQNREKLAKTRLLCAQGDPAQGIVGLNVQGVGAVVVGWSATAVGGDAPTEASTPDNTTLPTLSGTVEVGQTIEGDKGTWLNATSFTYQWKRSDNNGNNFGDVSGQTSASYTLTQADVGKRLLLEVTAHKGSKSAVKNTAATIAVPSTAPAFTTPPTINGVFYSGQTVHADRGEWVRTTDYSYKWERQTGTNWDAISGATGLDYQLKSADIGHAVRFSVTANNALGVSSTAYSNVSADVIAGAPANDVAPSITGGHVVGDTLTVDKGTWVNVDTYAYLWQREINGNFATISYAYDSTYVLSADDAGHRVRALVIGYGPGGQAQAPSNATSLVDGITSNTTLPSVSGSVLAGGTLTADKGTWEYASGGYSYQWQRASAASGPWVERSGETGTTYGVTSSDEGKYIRVQVTNHGVTASSTGTLVPVPVVNVSTAYTNAVNADTPTGYWRIDGSQTVANSAIGGTAGSATKVGSIASGTSPLTGFGDTGSASAVLGSGSYVVPSSSTLSPSGSDAYSIEFWFKSRGATGSEQYLLEKYGTGYAVRVDTGVFCNSSGGKLGLLYVSPNVCAGTTGATNYHTGNAWHHFVATRGGSTVKMYVDGSLVSTSTGVLSPGAGSTPLRIGARGDDGALGYNGSMAEVAFYNSELSALRVAAHYSASGH